MKLQSCVMVMLCIPAVAIAQDSTSGGCTYDACALRFDRMRIFRGTPPGQQVLRLSVWKPPKLAPVVVGSDSAVTHARVFDHRYPRANRLGFLAVATGVTGFFLMEPRLFEDGLESDWTSGNWAGVALVTISGVIGIFESRDRKAATLGLTSAIWWYNRSLPR